MRRDNERLADILSAIAAIERYVQQGRSAFDEQELIQMWVAYHLQMIGEAANSLSVDLKAQHPDIPWIKSLDYEICLSMNIFALILKSFGILLKPTYNRSRLPFRPLRRN